MKQEITNRWTGKVQFTAEIDCPEGIPLPLRIGLAVKWAIKNLANLRDADLSDADLRGANLSDANLSDANLSYADLRGANLRDANLSDANLSYADLRGANLRDADLSDADLRGANLSDANLSDANLSYADLRGANLRDANLSDANLSYADLRGANLSDANLSDANLSYADLRGANLSDANLSYAKNLRLPTGETWKEYLAVTVPALLVAGGKSLEEVATKEHWQCHSWDNCPMAVAFGVDSEENTPILLRPRVKQFVQFFDAGQIPLEAIKK